MKSKSRSIDVAQESVLRALKSARTNTQREKSSKKKRQNEIKIALVGYTNSGKTTLMHSLTKTTVGGKDELFATLDTVSKTSRS